MENTRQSCSDEVFTRLKEDVISRIDMSRDVSDKEVREIIKEAIHTAARTFPISLSDRERLLDGLFFEVRRLGILEELISDPYVTEIMVNGTEEIFYEKNGCLSKWNRRFDTEDKLRSVIQQIVAGSNRVVNEASPIVDARLFKEQKNYRLYRFNYK